MGILDKLCETAKIIPNLLIIRVENMRAKDVSVNTPDIIGVTIPGNVVTFFENEASFTMLLALLGKCRPVYPGPDD